MFYELVKTTMSVSKLMQTVIHLNLITSYDLTLPIKAIYQKITL